MRVLLLGCNGQIGRCLSEELIHTEHVLNLAPRSVIDICDFEDARKKILLFKPDVIINASAYTAVDKAEKDQENASLVNHQAVAMLAAVCADIGSWLIHISTDYVFDGKSAKPYTENDITNPQSIYGNSKLKGEMAISTSGCSFLIIRTAWVFSEFGSNFLKTMIRLAEEHDSLKIVGDQIGSPTYARDISKAILFTLPFLDNNQESGIFNYAGNHPCSWAEFAIQIFYEARRMGNIKDIPQVRTITSEEFPTPARRPKNSRLDSSKFEAKFGYKSSNWQAGITESLNYFREISN